MNDLLDFYSGIYNNKVVFGDFNLEPTNLVIISFMDSQNFTNLIENNMCFKGVGSCIDLILTNRKSSFNPIAPGGRSTKCSRNFYILVLVAIFGIFLRFFRRIPKIYPSFGFWLKKFKTFKKFLGVVNFSGGTIKTKNFFLF